ncbi:MAG TPA: hypothetical protein VIP09_07645 [Dehalococcoidia bacterium]|jgi:hypothetical protein
MALGGEDDENGGFRDRLHQFLFRRVFGEPVWLYLFWLTVCVVLSTVIIWGILSGATPCPAGTPGC